MRIDGLSTIILGVKCKKNQREVFILHERIDLAVKILARYENSLYAKPYLELKAPWNCAETWRVGSDGKGPVSYTHLRAHETF